jgi:endonuclease YncB( thermonuclease family)
MDWGATTRTKSDKGGHPQVARSAGQLWSIKLVAALIVTACMIAAGGATARPLTASGPVEVVDGDTLFIGEVEVRLKGVDAMEAWTREGQRATEAMMALAPDGSPVTCI